MSRGFHQTMQGVCGRAAAAYALTYAAVHARRCWRAARVVAFAGGKSGNHVFPAIAIAEELRKNAVEVVFLGDSRGLEVRVVPQYGFTLYCISSVELLPPFKSAANVLKVLGFPLCLAHSAWTLMQTSPDVVVGMGGRVSLPVCLAAAALGIPLVLYESNAKPGVVNQVLYVIARQTLLAYDSAAAGLRFRDRCQVVGPVVRSHVLGCAAAAASASTAAAVEAAAGKAGKQAVAAARRRRREARQALGVTSRDARLLLVLGGSKGSGYLNCAVNNVMPQLAAVPGLHVVWQTGAKQYVSYSAGYAGTLSSVRCVPFLHDLGPALAAADLVLSRAGSATVAELGALGVPALLVPSPAASEDQQTANAKVLADKGLAEVLPQIEVDEVGLGRNLLPLLASDGRQLAAMRAAALVASAGIGSVEPRGGVGSQDLSGSNATGVQQARVAILNHVRR